MRGQILTSVQWLVPFGGSTRGGDRFTPMVGDRVMLNYGLGYPVIVGFFPKLQNKDGSTPLVISTGVATVDMGNYSPQGAATRGDQNKPEDMVHGDRLLSSVGGAFLGLLRAGAVVLRSSRAAEIFMSNFHGLVRIVSRNWEHFTDAASDVMKNFNGRVYRFTGYAKTFADAKIEKYNLRFYHGDVAAAETIKTTYPTYTGTPPTDAIIYKEQVVDQLDDPTPREVMRRTLDGAGNQMTWILNGNQEIHVTNGTVMTKIRSTADNITITYNDENTVTITEASIHAVHKDGADYIMDAAGIRSTFEDGTINMSASNVLVEFGGSKATLENAQAVVENGAGKVTLSPAMAKLENGSHSVTITSGGVAIV